MISMFTACTSELDEKVELITGSIDSDVKGVITDDYLYSAGYNEEEALADRTTLIEDLVHNTLYYYGYSETVDLAEIEKIAPLYEELFENFEYTVKDAVIDEEGNVTATIAYKPFAIESALTEIANPFYDQVTAEEAGDLVKVDAELYGLFETELKKFLEEPKYEDEITVDITVYVYPVEADSEYDFGWELSDEYYGEFFYGIIGFAEEY